MEDSLDPDAVFAPDRTESDEDSDQELQADADAPVLEEEGDEEEGAADDSGRPHPLKDWPDDSGEEPAGAAGAAPRQPAADAGAKRKAAPAQPGSSSSRPAGKQPAKKRARAALTPSSDQPARAKKMKQRKIPESIGYVLLLLTFDFALSASLCLLFLIGVGLLASSQGSDQIFQGLYHGPDATGSGEA